MFIVIPLPPVLPVARSSPKFPIWMREKSLMIQGIWPMTAVGYWVR
jgi:hypothetical protein